MVGPFEVQCIHLG